MSNASSLSPSQSACARSRLAGARSTSSSWPCRRRVRRRLLGLGVLSRRRRFSRSSPGGGLHQHRVRDGRAAGVLIVRRPGAALAGELLAALFEAMVSVRGRVRRSSSTASSRGPGPKWRSADPLPGLEAAHGADVRGLPGVAMAASGPVDLPLLPAYSRRLAVRLRHRGRHRRHRDRRWSVVAARAGVGRNRRVGAVRVRAQQKLV